MHSSSNLRPVSPALPLSLACNKLLLFPLPAAHPVAKQRAPPPMADAACEALLQPAADGWSESASLLIDQRQINEALQTYCTSTMSSSPRKSSVPSDPYLQRLNLKLVGTYGGSSKDLIHVRTRSSSLRTLVSERLRIERRTQVGESGLMLSPAKNEERKAFRKRGEHRERLIPIELRMNKELAECRRRTLRKGSEGGAALLLASKGERVIRSSKAGRLLKCFKEDAGWLTVR